MWTGKTLLSSIANAEGKADRLAEIVAELVRVKVDVIVTIDSQGTQAAGKATQSIAIVMTQDRRCRGRWYREKSGEPRRKHHRADANCSRR